MTKGNLATQIIITPAFLLFSAFTVLFAKTMAVNTASGTPSYGFCHATVRAMAMISLAGTVHRVNDIWEI